MIKIIALGKTKQSFIADGIKEFKKRIKPFHKINIELLPDVKLSSSNTTELVKAKEADIILNRIDARDYVVALDERGKQFTSIDFANFIAQKIANHNITFIIGGVYGLDEKITTRANLILGFSKMTFTHQMIRFVLMEQIYRAFTIIRGKKYHY